MHGETGMETAYLGGGCFWCLEAVFRRLRGVRQVRSGYMGGQVPHPTYRQVCSGATGHAEVVEVVFDPAIISYTVLLEVFFAIHDPTTLNRQGADTGTQYRSVIFYTSELQRQQASAFMQTLEASGVFRRPIVTQLQAAGPFYAAEPYHQRYYEENAHAPYCRLVIAPKLQKLFARFPQHTAGTD